MSAPDHSEVIRQVLRSAGVALQETPDHVYLRDLADRIFFKLFIIDRSDYDVPHPEKLAIGRMSRQLAKLEEGLRDLQENSLIDSMRGGLIEDVIAKSSHLREELSEFYERPAVNPKTPEGEASIEIYQLLQQAQAGSVRDCCKIIADIFLETGISDTARPKLIVSLYDRLNREGVR